MRQHIQLFEQWINEKAELPKNRYVELTSQDAIDYADDIIDLINTSYAHIGGNLEYRSAIDIKNGDASFWILKDIDDEPDPEIAIGGKKTPSGNKLTVLSNDGSSSAKKDMILKTIELTKTRGFYVELDMGLAKKLGLKPIEDEKKVREVIKKELEWHGDGSYVRKVGPAGTAKEKVLVGIPK
jgi:hypothetical protein